MKKYILLPILLFAVGLTQSSCLEKTEKKYEYRTEVTSADGYKCYISWISCYLGEAPISFSTSGSWGDGNGMTLGPDMKSLPDTMQVIYYSLTENQFYKLKTSLPEEEIRSLLEGKYKREGYKNLATYTTFCIGIAPCGFVSLWLKGGAGQVLIGTYHAEKTEFNYKSAFPTDVWDQDKVFQEYTKSLYPFIKQEMQENRISSTYWESLNTSYKWKLEFSDPDFSLYDYDIYLVNQENSMYLTDPNLPMTEGEKFIPAELVLYLQHKLDPIKYKVVIKLRDKEIEYDDAEDTFNHMQRSRELLRFFDSFYKKAAVSGVCLYLDFDESMESMKLKLKTRDFEEEFPDYTYEIYDSERYDYK